MEDYYKNRRISNSSLSYINPEQEGSPQKLKEYFDGNLEFKQNLSLERGSLLHLSILESDKFVVSNIEKPDPAIVTVIDSLYASEEAFATLGWDDNSSNSLEDKRESILSICNTIQYQTRWKDETRVNKVVEKGTEYYNFLRENSDMIIISPGTQKILKACRESLHSNKVTEALLFDDLFEGSYKSYNEEEVYFNYFDKSSMFKVKCKAKLDRIMVDHENKTFKVVDLKTTGKPMSAFRYSYKSYHYYRQAAFYTLASSVWMEQNGYKDYTFGGFFFACVETGNYHIARAYRVSSEDLSLGKTEYQQLLHRVAYHQSTNQWIAPVEEEDNEGLYTLNLTD
jgi:hypothetical protein